MPIIFDGTLGITSPGGDTSNTSHTTPIVRSSANLVFQTSGSTEAMRINTAQNVGVGIANPTAKFHVYGGNNNQFKVESSGAEANFTIAGTSYGQINNDVGDWYLTNGSASGALIFRAGSSTERMRITSSGLVGIGTNNPNSNFLVTLGSNGAGLTTGAFVHRIGSGSGAGENIEYGGSFYVFHDGRTTSTPGFGNIACNRSSPAYSARNNGGSAYYAEAGGFTGPSDYRIKENIVPLTDGIDKVKQLKPIIFDYTDEAHWEDGNARHDGFLAHEVQEVVPDAVFGEKDGVDEDGKMVIQSLDKSRLIPLLTAAIQELNAKVEALETQLKEQAK